jgi:hypothetical protein
MQTNRFFALLTLSFALAACTADEGQPAPDGTQAVPVNASRAAFLRNVPDVPGSVLTDTTGAEDAQRASYLVRAPLDTVRAFYRRLLPALGWTLRSDQSDSTLVNLMLEKDTATIWIRATPSGGATAYTIIGAYTTYPTDTSSRRVNP